MIYNFYSYKGEVGRSMALAKLAECFCLQGLRVVAVDADLEGRALENFVAARPPAHGFLEQVEFVHGSETNPSAASSTQAWPGLLDLFVDYRRSFGEMPATGEASNEALPEDRPTPVPDDRIPSLAHYLVPIHSSDLENPFSDGGSLSLLPAGHRPQADAGPSLFRDKSYLEWLRKQLLREADVVLIDGPRAIESGIGTQLLADVVVFFCPTGEETLEGTSRMLDHLRTEESLGARDHRPLDILLVPIRSDPATPEEEGELDRRFARLIDQSPLPAPLQARGARLRDLQIAYPSEVTFREHGATEPSEAAYVALVSDLSLLAPEGHPLRRPAEPAAPPSPPAETAATESMPSLPTMLELFDEIRRELDAMPDPLVPDEPVTVRSAAPEVDAPSTEATPSAEATPSVEVSPSAPEAPALGDALPSFPLTEAAVHDEILPVASASAEPAPPVAEPTHAPESAPVAEPAAAAPAVAAPVEASERVTRPDPDRRPAETIEEPKQSLTSRPVVFETTPPPALQHASARRKPAWRLPAAGASLLLLVAAVYAGTRGHGDNVASEPRQTAAAPTTEKQPPAPVATQLPPAPTPPAQDPAPQAAQGAAAKTVASAEPAPDRGAPGSMYLRVGWGPSCPRILAYRKQFVAAGIPDAGAVQLKAGGCALVLGPYSPDVVEHKRKEQNARHIRGFDNVTVIDDRDFAKWL